MANRISNVSRKTLGTIDQRHKQVKRIREYALLLLLILFVLGSGYGLNSSSADNKVVNITFLHLNDVYEILPSDVDGSGGLARIATLKNQVTSGSKNVMFLLGGDTISPSLESAVLFKGEHIIDIWNRLGLDVSVLGNHEFDFKPDVLNERMKQSNFTWLAANVIDRKRGSVFGNAKPYIIKEFEGVKVGVFGLLTTDTKNISSPGPDIDFLDPIATACDIVPKMRKDGAQFIVALTHLSMEEDKKLAQAVKINLILGGHEHDMLQSISAGTPIYKMGSDARLLGRIDVQIDAQTGEVKSIDCKFIPARKDVAEEPNIKAIIKGYEDKLEAHLKVKLDEPIATSTVVLNAKQEIVRAQESNMGDYIADLLIEETKADVALINGGGIRSDREYPPGAITNRQIYSMLPFANEVVVIEVKGNELRQALEHSVENVVKGQGFQEDGGFLQVGGLQFVYNGLSAPKSRVVSVKVNGQPLDENKTYKVVTISYLAEGNQGYTMLKKDMTKSGKNLVDVVLARMKGKIITKETDGRIIRSDKQK